MAKYEKTFTGNFDQILAKLHNGILNGSFSASYEDVSDYVSGTTRCAVRVYERYSMMGGNRVSLNVTLIGDEEKINLMAITSGGSQALLFKINTFGEEAFLECVRDIFEE